ncbi:MAG: B12-binding domain-containing radical SAM protein [Candidatus Bathyarchaeota archaeon]|nr:B12-binding domain-containing radical SAM protein [Candidatus Bathyarchaeota archaeon]
MLKVKALLFNPPSPPGIMVDRRLGCTVKVKGSFLHPQIELAYVGSILQQRNHCEVSLTDCVAFGWNKKKALDHISELSPDIMFCVMGSFTYRHDIKFLEEIKALHPELPLVALGWQVSAIPEWYLERSEAIDFIVVGEPELTVSEMVRVMETRGNLTKVKGLAFKKSGEPVITPRREPIINIDDIPFPDRTLLKNELYHAPLLKSPFTVIFSSRGCPFRCKFCGSKNYWQRFRARSPENIIAEIRECIEKFKMKSFRFLDDTFTVNKKRVIRICELVLENGWDIEWACLSRVDTVDEEMLKSMSEAGCKQIFYGVESGSPKILEYLRKDQTVDDAVKAFEWSRKANILAGAYFILGTPIDNWSTIEETISLAKNLKPDFVGFNPVMPFPGSEIYGQLKEEGRLLHEDWERYITPYVVFQPDYLTPEEIMEANRRAYREIHLDPKFMLCHFLRLMKTRQITLAKELVTGFYHSLRGSL